MLGKNNGVNKLQLPSPKFPKLPTHPLGILNFFTQWMELLMFTTLKWTLGTHFSIQPSPEGQGPSVWKAGVALSGGWGKEGGPCHRERGRGVHGYKVGLFIVGGLKMEPRCQGKAHWSPWERRPGCPHFLWWGEINGWLTTHLAPVIEPNSDQFLLQSELPSDAADLLGCGLWALQEELLQVVSDATLPACPSLLPSLLQDHLHFA